jgi:hypothetical protein
VGGGLRGGHGCVKHKPPPEGGGPEEEEEEDTEGDSEGGHSDLRGQWSGLEEHVG